MILELKVKNFLSFKEEVTFSFEATNDKTFEDCQVVEIAPNVRILRLAAVFGPNASGKSNLLRVFAFLRFFLLNTPTNKGDKTRTIPFLLGTGSRQKPSEFSLVFYVKEKKYKYLLILDQAKVISEKLIAYLATREICIFDRGLKGNTSEITFNTEVIKISPSEKKEISVKCLLNMSVLAAYNGVNVDIPAIDEVITWIKKQFLLPIFPDTGLVKFAEKVVTEHETSKKHILDFLGKADFNIENINVEKSNGVPDGVIAGLLSKSGKLTREELEKIINESSLVAKTTFIHKVKDEDGISRLYPMPMALQSEGTIRTYGLASVIDVAVANGGFLAIDEIESSTHPRLVEFIIEDFLEHYNQSQLLLTSHYDGLLEDDGLLRKDSIWFTEKKETGATDLYSLIEFQGALRIKHLQKAYRYGKFGAIPNI